MGSQPPERKDGGSLSFIPLTSPTSPAPAADAKEVAQVHNPALGEVVQVVPPPTGDGGKGETKRAALLLDKIMFAVQKALDEKEKPGGGKKGGSSGNINLASFTGPGMERRGSAHDRVYWRCYF